MKISKFLQSLNVCLNKAISFFNKKIINQSQIFDSNLETKAQGPMRVQSDLITILESLKNQPAKIHDIKIQFNSNIHRSLQKRGYAAHPQNKSIIIKHVPLTDKNIIVKALVYPNTVQVDVGCSYNPIIRDTNSLLYLQEILKEISIHLYDLTGTKLPSVKDWIITHWHLNKDGRSEISGPRFNITIAEATGELIRYYSKRMPDGTIIPRLEQIQTPHTTLAEEIQHSIELQKRE